MTDLLQTAIQRRDALRDEIREVRVRYDRLTRGQTAGLRRCRSADDIRLHGIYWRLGGELAVKELHLADVVLLFPTAPHSMSGEFSFGRFLRETVGDSVTGSSRFRRVLESSDRDALDRGMRGLITLASAGRHPVDWGVLGVDLLWYFGAGGVVRRLWAQGYFAWERTSAYHLQDALMRRDENER